MSNRQYDFTLSAVLGSSQRIDATGSKLKVLTSPAGPVGIKIDGGPEIQLMEGQGFNMPPGKTFRDVLVRNLQAVANTGTIFIGEEGFEDSRVTGNVKVIDQAVDKTAGGNQFAGSITKPAVAGAWGLIGVKANTKRVAVKRIVVASDTAGTLGLWFATGAPTVNPGGAASWQNKMSNGAASDCQKVTGESAGAPTAGELPGGVNWLNIQVSANVPSEIPITTPIVLAAGAVLIVGGWAVNRQLQVVMDLEEFA